MEQFTNLASTTLNGGISNSTTSVVVNSASSFPTSGNFRIIVESEIMLVTAVSSNTFTVTRGYESTSAVSHNSGVTVKHVLTAGGLQGFRADTITSGTAASLPTAGTAGRLFASTDSAYVYQDNGTSWTAWGPIYPLTPVVNSSFSDLNTPTVSTSQGVVNITAPGTSSDVIRGRQIALPSTPYTITTLFLMANNVENFHIAGLHVYDNGTGKVVTWGIRLAGDIRVHRAYWNSVTSFNAESHALTPYTKLFFQLHDDGTNFSFKFSPDGITYRTYITESRTAFLTPTHVGMFVHENSPNSTSVDFLHWAQT